MQLSQRGTALLEVEAAKEEYYAEVLRLRLALVRQDHLQRTLTHTLSHLGNVNDELCQDEPLGALLCEDHAVHHTLDIKTRVGDTGMKRFHTSSNINRQYAASGNIRPTTHISSSHATETLPQSSVKGMNQDRAICQLYEEAKQVASEPRQRPCL